MDLYFLTHTHSQIQYVVTVQDGLKAAQIANTLNFAEGCEDGSKCGYVDIQCVALKLSNRKWRWNNIRGSNYTRVAKSSSCDELCLPSHQLIQLIICSECLQRCRSGHRHVGYRYVQCIINYGDND